MNTLKLLKTFGNVSICHKFLQTSFVLSKKLDWKDDMKVVLLTTKKVQQENKKRVPDNPDDFDKLQVKSLTKDFSCHHLKSMKNERIINNNGSGQIYLFSR